MKVTRVEPNIKYNITIEREEGEHWPIISDGWGKTVTHWDAVKVEIEVRLVDQAWSTGPAWISEGYRVRQDGSRGARMGRTMGHSYQSLGRPSVMLTAEAMDKAAIAAARTLHNEFVREWRFTNQVRDFTESKRRQAAEKAVDPAIFKGEV